jgi:hypothetical protein
LRASRAKQNCLLEFLEGQIIVLGVEQGYSSDTVDGSYPEVEILVFLLNLKRFQIIFKGFDEIVEGSIAISSVGQYSPIL